MGSPRLHPRLGLLLFGLGASGCVQYDFGDKTGYTTDVPAIVVDPTDINFGVLDPGTSTAEVVTILNNGTAALDITSLTPTGASAFTITSDHMLDALDPGESTEFKITYTADGLIDTGSVLVDSTDPTTPEVPVTLTGGLTGPTLLWDPDPMDFGYVAVGDSDTETMTLSNTGGADLVISDIAVDGDGFSATMPTFPLTLATGEETTMDVTFTPTSTADATGTLTATSNADSDNQADLAGTSSTGPIAVCSVDPDAVTAHSDKPTWIGDESYDPSGAAITTYDWTLISQPTGSSASMPSSGGAADRRNFAWDLAGTYVGQLIVTNERGEVSDPCTATLTATPTDDLWIEMYWTHSGDDMDLHLLAPGGSKETSQDCYFANCTGSGLDWGVRGDSSDNPSLDIDDIPGTGPENTRIESPEDGVYTVYVNDYPTSVYTGANPVTVTIYIGGAVAWTDTRSISGENAWEEFATISMPDGTVTSR